VSVDPDEFIISRKRKKYKFARFSTFANCYEADELNAEQVAVMGAKREIILEIGAGTGFFAVELARRHPDQFFVAADVKSDRLQSGAKQAIEEKITNIIFVRIHTSRIAELFLPHSVTSIWLTFSDPFPRDRQAKHRLAHPRFLASYAELLKPGGALYQKTDNHALFDWSLEQFVANKWHIRELSYDLHESSLPDEYKIMTTFEKRYTAEGMPIYFVSASF
jgi:tRNA (guanine-N7-)-methyltransferase